jgi:gas vesicle protein
MVIEKTIKMAIEKPIKYRFFFYVCKIIKLNLQRKLNMINNETIILLSTIVGTVGVIVGAIYGFYTIRKTIEKEREIQKRNLEVIEKIKKKLDSSELNLIDIRQSWASGEINDDERKYYEKALSQNQQKSQSQTIEVDNLKHEIEKTSTPPLKTEPKYYYVDLMADEAMSPDYGRISFNKIRKKLKGKKYGGRTIDKRYL